MVHKVKRHKILLQYFQHNIFILFFTISHKEATTSSTSRATQSNPLIDKIIPRREGILVCALEAEQR